MTIRELIENGTITLDTKVLGTLPVTADGCVVGEGDYPLYKWGTVTNDRGDDVPGVEDVDYLDGTVAAEQYSTREAALAARGGEE